MATGEGFGWGYRLGVGRRPGSAGQRPDSTPAGEPTRSHIRYAILDLDASRFWLLHAITGDADPAPEWLAGAAARAAVTVQSRNAAGQADIHLRL